MMIKKYDPVLDDLYGKPAEQLVIDLLNKRDYISRVTWYPRGHKDVDIAYTLLGVGFRYYVDVERRRNWKSGDYPFNTIHVPYRKKKLFDLYNPVILYAVVRDDLRAVAWLKGEDILVSPVVSLTTSETPDEEDQFFDVPVEKIIGYDRKKEVAKL